MLELVHADDREGLVARLRQTIADKRERQTFEFRVHAAGERQPQWLSTRMLLAYGADGQPRQLVGVSFDITEHKAAEEARTALTAIEQRARLAAPRTSSWPCSGTSCATRSRPSPRPWKCSNGCTPTRRWRPTRARSSPARRATSRG
jgi:hypothetical protein